VTCSEEDLRLISTFRRIVASEFERPRLAVKPAAVLEVIGDGMPIPAVTDPGMTSRQIIDDLKQGIEQWINGNHEQAAELLAQDLDSAKLNPVPVVSDPSLRQLIPRAHVARAVSLWRLGRRAPAKEAISELARTLAEQSILDAWGTEAEKIFQLARKELH